MNDGLKDVKSFIDLFTYPCTYLEAFVRCWNIEIKNGMDGVCALMESLCLYM